MVLATIKELSSELALPRQPGAPPDNRAEAACALDASVSCAEFLSFPDAIRLSVTVLANFVSDRLQMVNPAPSQEQVHSLRPRLGDCDLIRRKV